MLVARPLETKDLFRGWVACPQNTVKGCDGYLGDSFTGWPSAGHWQLDQELQPVDGRGLLRRTMIAASLSHYRIVEELGHGGETT